MSVQSPQQEGGNCHTGPVPPGQQPSHQDIREALVLTVSDPSDHHICMTAPRQGCRHTGLSGPVAAGSCCKDFKPRASRGPKDCVPSPGLPVKPLWLY